jgi:single-strand DNA-binding protein
MRSLNRAVLIGNLTRDPDMRQTPSGISVCSFAIATNRSWVEASGEKKDEVEFHNIVAWNKLAEICGQYLHKGSKVYLDGRLTTRKFTKDDVERQSTEIILNDMIMLDSMKGGEVK